MNPLFYLRSFQNSVSFAIRSHLRLELRPKESPTDLKRDERLRAELRGFLDLFDWNVLEKSESQEKRLVIADMGARDFGFARVFDEHFREMGYAPEIHGIELDAYRRYSNFVSRADFGRQNARRIRLGAYHPVDFLDFNHFLDVCFFLHPFVTPEPPLRWGLPLSKFRPRDLFDHAFRLLKPRKGLLVMSNPTTAEFEAASEFAEAVGFVRSEKQIWRPTEASSHRMPRIGTFWKT